MPEDSAFIAARQRKPGDLRRVVADRYERHPTVSAATQTNTGDLAEWHVNHAANLQPFRFNFRYHVPDRNGSVMNRTNKSRYLQGLSSASSRYSFLIRS
jgi:hypothetical protein